MSGGGRVSRSARLANREPRATAGSSAGNSTGTPRAPASVAVSTSTMTMFSEYLSTDWMNDRASARGSWRNSAMVTCASRAAGMKCWSLTGGLVGLFAAQGGLNALVAVHGARSGQRRGAAGEIVFPQEARTRIIGEKTDVAPPRFGIPADETVAAAQVPRRRTPGQTGNRPSLSPQNILEMLPHRLLRTEVVIVLHQAIEQRFVGRAPRGIDLNRAQRPQRHRQRRGVDQDRLWPGTPRAALAADVAAYRRQLDLAGPRQHQE